MPKNICYILYYIIKYNKRFTCSNQFKIYSPTNEHQLWCARLRWTTGESWTSISLLLLVLWYIRIKDNSIFTWHIVLVVNTILWVRENDLFSHHKNVWKEIITDCYVRKVIQRDKNELLIPLASRKISRWVFSLNFP